MTTLYVTADGVLEPLGYSQVVRVVDGLSRRGREYVLLSLEKAGRLADLQSVTHVRERLRDAGVEWISMPFREGGSPVAAARNLAAAIANAARIARRRRVRRVHARAYHGAAIALALKGALSIPYLFDTRSYWFDERIEDAATSGRRRAFELAKKGERTLYRHAAGAVTLTQLQADDLSAGALGPWNDRPLAVITTTADFDDFTMTRRPLPDGLDERFRGRTVVGFIGSLNGSYLIDRSTALLRRFLAARPEGFVVALTAQVDTCRETFLGAGLDPERMLVRNVPHEEMPLWLPWLDWTVLFLKSTFAKRASMPTKLAELFASGVRPLHNGCNEEVGAWVRATGSGLSLADVTDASLDAVIPRLGPRGDLEELERARERARPHFSLASGIERYLTLHDRLDDRSRE